MADRINIQDPRVLVELKDELERCTARARIVIGDSETAMALLKRRFDAVEDRCLQRLNAARRMAASADEDDDGAAQAAVEEAEAQLRASRRAIDNAVSALARMQRAASTAGTAANQFGRRGVEYLATKIGELRAYTFLTPGRAVAAAAAAASGGGVSPASAAATLEPPTYEQLKAFPLPLGWRWVKLDEIDSTLQLGDRLDFKDGQRDWLISAYQRLLSDVLPMIDRNHGAARDRVVRDDYARGIYDTSGKSGCFDTFFQTGEPIHLQRGRHGLWVIDGGRHRIEIARQLGWPAVPARTQGP